MVFCIVAIVVFAFMGIFSGKYRTYAKEAWICVRRTIVLKPCDTEFDQKMKTKITSKLMKRSPGLARFVFRKFETISVIFVIITLASLGYTAYGLANLAIHGTCDPTQPDQCVFNPQDDPNKVVCPFENLRPENAVETIGGFKKIPDAQITGKPLVYFFGATGCPHCKWERPIFLRAVEKFKDHVEYKKVEIDEPHKTKDIAVFIHYSPEGKIPLIVFAGKYYRLGSGEFLSEETDEAVLTAFLCKITGNPIEECNNREVAELVERI